jgi:hypothetical protein
MDKVLSELQRNQWSWLAPDLIWFNNESLTSEYVGVEVTLADCDKPKRKDWLDALVPEMVCCVLRVIIRESLV